MTWRRTGLLLVLLALLSTAAGLGLGLLTDPGPAEGLSEPAVAEGPRTPQREYRKDRRFPALRPGVDLSTDIIGEHPFDWIYTYPEGWRLIREGTEVFRFRPADAPETGAYSVRVQHLDSNRPVSEMVTDQKADMLADEEDVTVIDETDSSIRFTFRDGLNHRRWNYYKWIESPTSGLATVEIAVAGRRRDAPGLDDLFARMTARKERTKPGQRS